MPWADWLPSVYRSVWEANAGDAQTGRSTREAVVGLAASFPPRRHETRGKL